MKKFLVSVALLASVHSFAQSTSYQKAWEALNKNDRAAAALLLQEAMKDPAQKMDAYISNLYLQAYSGKDNEVQDFANSFYTQAANPYPYIFALWFNNAVLGGYGKKKYVHQVKLADELLKDTKAPGTIIAAANYQKGMHNLFSNDFKKAQANYDAVGNIRNWQFVGPFENISESGIYKSYGPEKHPEAAAFFNSVTNAKVQWFTPTAENPDGWTPVSYQFPRRTAVVYAQTFIESAKEQQVLCNLGFTGAIRLWVNDVEVLTETRERVTEMDAFSARAVLKAGVNRVLVQLAYSDKGYANFCLRLTDDNYRAVDGLTNSAVYKNYTAGTSTGTNPVVPHFAESFFESKVKKEAGNLVNYLLLADVYMRDNKVLEARQVLADGLEKAPSNSLLRMKLIEALNKEDNQTQAQEELERIKQDDPLSKTVMDIKIKEHYDNEKFEDATAEIKKRIALHGEDETTDGYKVLLMAKEQKYDDLVKEAERMFIKYPDNFNLVSMMYTLKKDVYKDRKGAMKVYENFMSRNFNYDVYETYANILSEQGDTKKSLAIKQDLAKNFPYNPYGFIQLSKYHFGIKDYSKAEAYTRDGIKLAPYYEAYWEQLGDIKNETNNKEEALQAYNESLKYNPNQYGIIAKIRKLNNLPELSKLINATDIDAAIANDKPAEATNTDYGYYFILDEKNVVMHPGGATEEFVSYVLRITNEKGVDRYKESSIGYDNNQDLLIEKAEIIKKNNAHIQGERNGNEVVFTNLEVGDLVVFKYRLQRYVYGRFAKEYWDQYYLNSQVYSGISRYSIMIPKDEQLNFKVTNGNIKPTEKIIENFKQYSWEHNKATPLKDEPLMPQLVDVGEVLHISTLKDWNDVANWYADVSNNKAEEDLEIIALYNKLLKDLPKTTSQYAKARIIYDYLEKNIRYSSVSFRQSAYVPQRPSQTLSTRLGDCKDFSSLFVTLAQMAGINAQLVLVNTRDNGDKAIVLPSVEFNHCIAKAVLDGKPYYIELTDNYLPFGSLPNNLVGAAILEIPYRQSSTNATLITLNSATKTKDVVKRNISIVPNGTNLDIAVDVLRIGNPSSSIRSTYVHLDEERKMQEMEKVVAGGYKNNVKLNKLVFKNLDLVSDSVSYNYAFKVKDEVAEIGSMNTFRVFYPDVVASLNNFSAETREFPVEYWTYEDVDSYETTVTIAIPDGKKFIELPTSEKLTFRDMKFELHYNLVAPGKLVISRKFSGNRQNISAAEYPAFREFFEKIVKAEQKFIAYK